MRLGLPHDQPLALKQHGLLLAVNYAARKFGIPSRCNATVAKEKCPSITIVEIELLEGVKPSLTRYREASARVMLIIQRMLGAKNIALIERASIDEAYLDLSFLEALPPERFAPRADVHVFGDEAEAHAEFAHASKFVCALRDCIFTELGYTMSAGVAHNKLLAKMASARFKPNALTLVPASAARELLATCKSLRKVPGFGGKLGQSVLEAMDCDAETAVRKVQATPNALQLLCARLGAEMGPWVFHRLHGKDDSKVVEKMRPKSLLSSKSFSRDKLVVDEPTRAYWLRIQSDELAHRLKTDHRAFSRVPQSLTVHFRGDKVPGGFVTRRGRLLLLDPDDVEASAKAIVAAAVGILDKLPLPCHTLGLALDNFDDVDAKQTSMDAFVHRSVASASDKADGGDEDDEDDDAFADSKEDDDGQSSLRPQTSHELGAEVFVDNFLKASRLSFIGLWKRRFEALLDGLPDAPALPPSRLPGGERVLLHVDMDAYFATVALLDRPELRNTPVAVCWGGGASEVSSCNYIARSKGVTKGMWLASALKLCPELRTLPFDFDRLQDVGERVMRALFALTPHVEGVSCDEAFVDATDLVDSFDDVAPLLQRVRAVVQEASGGCTATVGAGPSRLVARVVGKSVKPNGARYVRQGVADFLAPLRVRELPSIGHAAAAKLEAAGVSTVADLQRAEEKTMKELLGAKQGANAKAMAAGVDVKPWAPRPPRRSVSTQVSWGVRMQSHAEVVTFVDKLARETAARLRPGASGQNVTLKVWRAVQNQPEHMRKGKIGHGICDVLTRSVAARPRIGADDADRLAKAGADLFSEMKISADEVRGVGLALGGLDDRTELKTRPAKQARAAGPRSVFAGASSGDGAATAQVTEAHVRHELRRAMEEFWCGDEASCAMRHRGVVCTACMDGHLAGLRLVAGLAAKAGVDVVAWARADYAMPEGHALRAMEAAGGGVLGLSELVEDVV